MTARDLSKLAMLTIRNFPDFYSIYSETDFVHNKIKQRIRNRELVKYEYVDKYKDISPCLLLYFNTDPNLRPIRKHKFEEYQALLDNYTI